MMSALLFVVMSAVCLLEARTGGGSRGGSGRGTAVHAGGGRSVRVASYHGGGRRAGYYGGRGRAYAYGGRRWGGYGWRGRGVGLGVGPLFIGSGISGGFDSDDCYYDEFNRLVCFSPWD